MLNMNRWSDRLLASPLLICGEGEGTIDADTGSRQVHPELPVPLTKSELGRLITLTAEERDWTTAVAPFGLTRVAILQSPHGPREASRSLRQNR